MSVTTGAHGDVRDVRTLHAIHALGLIELVATRRTDNRLNRGAFGRWIGGSHDVSYPSFNAKPTALGRAVLRG